MYKVLLAGKNEKLIKGFFDGEDNKFTFQTTSLNIPDIKSHFRTFAPDVLLYCIDGDSPEEMSNLASAKNAYEGPFLPLFVVGDTDEVNNFSGIAKGFANGMLPKGLTSELIKLKLESFLESQKASPKDEYWSEVDKLMEILSHATPPEPQKKHILVVDDDVRMLKVLKEYLHDDYDVSSAVSGNVALRFLSNKSTDLILLDYEMPGEDGPAVLEQLRANPNTKDIPVIFLTGITQKEKIEKALVMKPQGYLLKPVKRTKLMDAIARVFDGGQ